MRCDISATDATVDPLIHWTQGGDVEAQTNFMCGSGDYLIPLTFSKKN